MIAFLSSLAFASQSPDFLDRVAENLLLEASNRLELPINQVEILHLGLQNSSCPEDAEIDVYFPQAEDFRGTIDVFIQAYDKDGLCGKWRTNSRVAVYKSSWVAETDTAPGERIKMVEKLARFDLSSGTPVSVSSQKLLARTQIRAGELITVERSHEMPDAKDGSHVFIIVSSGRLQIKSDGSLMGNAKIGDSVKVIADATNQVLDGVLVDPQTVSITLGSVGLGDNQ